MEDILLPQGPASPKYFAASVHIINSANNAWDDTEGWDSMTVTLEQARFMLYLQIHPNQTFLRTSSPS